MICVQRAQFFPDGYIRQLARTTGATKRLRNVDPVHLFWTLVRGFGVGRERTLADLRRRYIHARGNISPWVESGF
jgi:hypothetical protein